MDIEDVLLYVFYVKKQHPDWGFDDITGGTSEFVDKKAKKNIRS